MLLGSGELGKEFAIAAQRLGQRVIAVDRYPGAPAMAVAHASEVIDMLDGHELKRIVALHKPDIIVPEIEAIRTEALQEFEDEGIFVVPTARAERSDWRPARSPVPAMCGSRPGRRFFASVPQNR